MRFCLHFGASDFPSKNPFKKCFKIVFFSLWRRNPVLELQFPTPLRVVLLCLLRGFTEATVATSLPPGTGRAKLCSASSMVEAALESQTSTAASVQPPVVND